MTKQDKKEFRLYLRQCTDNQVWGCYEKERVANRKGYVKLCLLELARRGMLP